MGNRVMKNDRNCVRTVESESSSNIHSARQPSDLTTPADTNSNEPKITSEDAVSLTTDSPTVSTTEYESASANDNDTTSLNRLSSCTDVSYDIPFETADIAMATETPVERTDQVSVACVGSVVCSQEEEDEFYCLLTDDPPRADDQEPSPSEENLRADETVVEYQPQNVEEDTETPHSKTDGESQSSRAEAHQLSPVSKCEFSRVSDALCDVLDKVSAVLQNCDGEGAQSSRPVRLALCSRRLVQSLNLRARFPEVFDFNTQKVVLCLDGLVCELEEELVDEFLADRISYLDTLKTIVFELAVTGRNSSYFARVNKEQVMTSSGLVLLLQQDVELRDLREGGWYESMTDNALQSNSAESDVDMNSGENVSEAGPTTAANIDCINNIRLLNDSCDLEFISKVGGTGLVAENLRKQSLYVKFDPLVADEANSSVNGDTTLTNDVCNLTLNDTVLDTNHRPTNDERHSSSAEVTDSNEPVGKLISVTPNRSPRKKKSKANIANEDLEGQSPTPKSSPRFVDTDPDDLNELKSLLLKQMKREETFKEEIESVRREHEQTLQRLQNVEKEKSQMRIALDAALENEKKLKNELKERIKSKQQLSLVMEEYEKTISQMVTRRDEEKREFEAAVRKVEAERDSAIQHLNNLENAFNDVHQKYERGKNVNEALKRNEDILKKSLTEYEVTVKTVENKYELLKSHATSQLEKANQELELITQTYEKEQAKLKAMLRKSEIQINSLQNSLDQKAKENQELTAVCDELIVKLSTHSNA